MTDTEILDWYIGHWPKVVKCAGQVEPFFVLIIDHTFPPINNKDFRECVRIAAETFEMKNS